MHASMWFSVRVLFQESLFLSCQSRELLILSTLTGGCTLESLWTPGYVAEPSLCVCVCVCGAYSRLFIVVSAASW